MTCNELLCLRLVDLGHDDELDWSGLAKDNVLRTR